MNIVTPPRGFEDCLEALSRIEGMTVIGHSGNRPERVDEGEWYVNVDFERTERGWEAFNQLTAALHTPPEGMAPLEAITFYVWADAGPRFTIDGEPGTDPQDLAMRVRSVLANWEGGW